MRFAELQDLSDQASIYSHLTQLLLGDHIEETLGRHRWDADMTERRLSFISEEHDGRIDARLSFVASIAPGPRSMLWGWSHPQYGDGYAEQLRTFGVEHGIEMLTTGEVPLPSTATGPDLVAEIADVAHQVGQVAVHVTGDGPYYSAPISGGSRIVVMLSGYDFPRPRIDHRSPTRIPMAFSNGFIDDHRRAFHGLGVLAGWTLDWADDWSRVELTDPVTGNAMTASFDELNRLSRVNATIGPTGP